MTLTFPKDSIQYLVEPWWITTPGKDYCRGRLIRAFVPHVDQVPKKLATTGRKEATAHEKAYFKIEEFRIHQTHPQKKLPVAAMPEIDGEQHGVYRVKKRPLVILCPGGAEIPTELRRDKPRWQTAPAVLAAPYYGRDEGLNRSGFGDLFAERIRRCEYPQYVWDMLPLKGAKESILRLDHLQPVGRHHDAIESTEYCLSKDALGILDEWIEWLWTGNFKTGSLLCDIREELIKLDSCL